MGGAWAFAMLSGLCDTAGGELMRSKAKTRSILQRAASPACIWNVSSVWYVPGDQEEGPNTETRSVLQSAVSFARSWKMSPVWYDPGD